MINIQTKNILYNENFFSMSLILCGIYLSNSITIFQFINGNNIIYTRPIKYLYYTSKLKRIKL